MNKLKTKLRQLAMAAFAAVLGFAANTAAAEEQSETIATTADEVYGTHFTISNNDDFADDDGMAAPDGITVTPRNKEYITKVVITCGWGSAGVSDDNTSVSSGTKTITNGGGTITVTDVNASTFTFTCNNPDPKFKQFVVYYLDLEYDPATDYAATWSEDQTIDSTQTIIGTIAVTDDITLTIEEGVTLTVNGGIDANPDFTTPHTLTVEGGGELIVKGSYSDLNWGFGVSGNIIVNAGKVSVIGAGGEHYVVSGNVTVNDGSVMIGGGNLSYDVGVFGDVFINGGTTAITGGNGPGDYDMGKVAVIGNVTVSDGSVTMTGGNAGLDDFYDGGDGVRGTVTVTGGMATISGGNGGSSQSLCGRAVTEAITGKAEESDDNSTWTAVSGTSSTKQYVKVTAEAAPALEPVPYLAASVGEGTHEVTSIWK